MSSLYHTCSSPYIIVVPYSIRYILGLFLGIMPMSPCRTCLDLNRQAIRDAIDVSISPEALEESATNGCIECQVLQEVLLHFHPFWKTQLDDVSDVMDLVCLLVVDDEDEEQNVWQVQVYRYYESRASEQLNLEMYPPEGK